MFELAIPVVYVRNSSAAERFYCQQLGFKKQFEHRQRPDADDPRYLGLSRGEAWLHLSSFPDDGVRGSVVYLRVYSVDALYAEFFAQGVAIEQEPFNHAWGTREMLVRDVDGNGLRFSQER